MTAAYDLRFGDIDMSPNAQVDDVEYRVYGLRRGYPAPAAVVVNSMIQDGANERIDRHENRDQSIVIGLRAADSEALAQAESALFLECQKERTELAWTPADGYGATTVFDVLWASLEFADADDWDVEELLRCERVYTLTVRALPFGRSDVEVTDGALSSGVTPTSSTISNGTSATNWTNDGPGAVIASGDGRLTITRANTVTAASGGTYYKASGSFTYTPVSPLDFSSMTYLSVDYKYISGGTITGTTLRAFADEVELEEVAILTSTTPGLYRKVFLCPDASVASLRLLLSSQNFYRLGTTGPASVTFEIDNVTQSNQAPSASSTGRESLRTIAVTGSARTQTSLAIQHETSSLGDVLVYTCPELGTGYSPDLLRWRTSAGTQTADASTVSGFRETLTTTGYSMTFNVPAAGLPRGTYVLMAKMRGIGGPFSRSLSWETSTLIDTAQFGTVSGTSSLLSFTTSSWTLAPLGVVTLPPTDVSASSSASVQIKIGNGNSFVELDEAWIFYLGDDAALTQVSCGSGTPAIGARHNRLWLDSASLDQYQPSMWVGLAADRSDSFHAGNLASSWGVHSFAPPTMQLFVVTTGAANPDVSLRHYPRWHTHAQQVS